MVKYRIQFIAFLEKMEVKLTKLFASKTHLLCLDRFGWMSDFEELWKNDLIL